MTQSCPLCGKIKTEEALFCSDCAHRIRTDYEVMLPEEKSVEPEMAATDTESRAELTFEFDRCANDPQTCPDLSSGITSGNEREQEKGRGEVDKDGEKKETAEGSGTGQGSEKVVGQENRKESEQVHEHEYENIKGKRVSVPLLILFALILLAGGYMVFNKTVRERNLERRGWDTALNLNSVEGYLGYMSTFPKGSHFDEAQEAFLRLKSEEATQWEHLKASDNTAELRDFLDRHPDIPFAPLVEKRLDSLSWAGATRANTPEAYSEYIYLSQQGQLRGDYIAEAHQKREELLSALVESIITDSIPE